MKISGFGLLLSAAVCLNATMVLAKTMVRVETVTGQVWDGEIVSENAKEIVILGKGGQFSVPRSVIKTIARTEQTAPDTRQPVGPPIATSVDLLRLHGSNTIGAQLGPDLLNAFGKQKKYTSSHEEPGLQPDERMIIMDAAESSGSMKAEVFAHGSGTAFTDMIAGTTDIGMASRPVTAAEVEALKSAGVGDMTQPGAENIIALDGITFLINRNNPVKSLTLEQLHDLMTGVKTNWAAVGGPNLPVKIYSRDQKSGTFDLVKEKILGHDGKLAASAKLYESSEDLSDAVAGDASGLGFAGFAYVRNAKPLPIDGGCGLPPSEPDVFVVKTEEYPLSRRLFMYVGNRRSDLVNQFLAFASSPAANSITEAAGFVGLEPGLAPAALTDARLTRLSTGMTVTPTGRDIRPERDQELNTLKGAQRLSITFRFAIGQSSVDSRSSTEFDRLARWVHASAPDKQIVFVGFSSTDGDYSGNVALARRRAGEIEATIRKLGVTNTKSIGVGPIDQVVCEADAASANLNRRVEVWVK
jgi:phosphate transport system substrate-binding protein